MYLSTLLSLNFVTLLESVIITIVGAVIGGLFCTCLPVIIVACVSCFICCGRKSRRRQPTTQQVTDGGTYTPPTVGSKEVDPAAAAYLLFLTFLLLNMQCNHHQLRIQMKMLPIHHLMIRLTKRLHILLHFTHSKKTNSSYRKIVAV